MNVVDMAWQPVTITVGKLKGAPSIWVVVDDSSLVYAEFGSLQQARDGANAAAGELRRAGFSRVTIDDSWWPRTAA